MKTSLLKYLERESDRGKVYLDVLVKLDSSGLGKEQIRNPIHLALVLDRSGSMAGTKLDLTKEASCRFINMLTRRDYIAVIAYDTSSQVICHHTLLDDKPTIMNKIKHIEYGESTNLSGGWLSGLSEIISGYTKDHFHHIVLLTDGLANVGVTEPAKLIQIGAKHLEKGIKTTTLGFGDDFDETLLKSIAEYSGGRFYFVEGPEDIGKAFHSEFGEISRIVGQNLNVKLELTGGVTLDNLFLDYPGEVKETSFNLQLGDVLADDEKQVLFRLHIPSSFPLAEDIGKLTISYFCVADEMGPYSDELGIKAEEPAKPTAHLHENEIKQEIWLAMSSKIKIQAADIAETGETRKARGIIEDHIKRLDEMNIKSEAMSAEKNRLIALCELIDEKEISGIKKTVYHESYLMREKRGSYAKQPGVDIMEEEINPAMPEMKVELGERLRSLLNKKNYTGDSTDNICIVLNELLNNAIEHGCKNVPQGKIKISIRIAPMHVKIIIKDPGRGFDYKRILDKIEKEKKAQNEKGHGLMIVKGLCLRLSYSDNGSRVEAVIMKSRMQMESFITRKGENVMTIEDIVVIRLIGSIDMNNLHEVRGQIQKMIDFSYTKIILDMSDVSYIDSSGIGTLLIVLKRMSMEPHGALVLANPSHQVIKILNLSNLFSYFTVFPSLDDAIQYLRE